MRETSVIEKTTITVDCYSRAEIQKFNIHDNGFEFITLDEESIAHFREFAKYKKSGSYDEEMDRNNETKIRNIVKNWASNRDIPASIVVRCSSLGYRDTGNPSEFQALPVAHVDFVQDQFSPLIQDAMPERPLSGIVNLWLPLNELPPKDTLALMDLSSVNKEDLKSCLFASAEGNQNKQYSQIVLANPSQKWVALEDMKIGDAVIFYSEKTGHGGVHLDRPWVACDSSRQSLDVRLGCFGPSRDSFIA